MGEFPYPLSDGPDESRYMTWLRNHSNYMLENGATDYLRIVAVLVRGIFLNFLILLPYFLLFGAVMAMLHLSMSIPTRVTFELESQRQSGGGGGGTQLETLTITGVSNFGETRATQYSYDRRPSQALQSLMAIGLDAWESDDFPDLEFTVIEGGVELRRRDGETVVITPELLAEGDTVLNFPRRLPLPFSGYLLLAAAGIVIFYPIFVRMSRVRRYRSARRTGHFSSVKGRDSYEQFFGKLLLFMIVAALVEAFPLLTSLFHAYQEGEVALAVPTIAAMGAGIVAANQILPTLGGWAKQIGIFLVGLLGLAIPLLVVLFVVEFLVYTDKTELAISAWEDWIYYGLLVPPALFTFLLSVTFFIGIGSFRLRGYVQITTLLVLMGGFLAAVMYGTPYVRREWADYLYVYFVVVIALEIMIYCWLSVDVNQTSINGLYRDRLASAYLIGANTDEEVDIEQDINLQEICNYDAGATAPYHIVNVALNLQNTKDIGVRDRNSDFFIFSKRFVGSDRTGYCRSENMEAVFPQMDLGTAMAISAAAAAPNMGRSTSPLMVAFLTLLNIRLGFWVPHPDRLERYLRRRYNNESKAYLSFDKAVIRIELGEIQKRRASVYGSAEVRPLDKLPTEPGQDPEWAAVNIQPTVDHNLVGLAFSGGGIRSATINLGIVQELHRRGVFDHVDYMSSVSGGGYLASSITTLMRHKVAPHAPFDGRVSLPEKGKARVILASAKPERAVDLRFADDAEFSEEVAEGNWLREGEPFLKRLGPAGKDRLVSLMDSFHWRVRPSALGREMLSRLDEDHDWVNLSDGGHIENLATIELLRRRCRIIFVGDGEADPSMHFNGLATLIRFARIDLGIDIDINVDPIRLRRRMKQSRSHFAVGRIKYPKDPANNITEHEFGHLVYMKSSFTGDEDEVIKEYRDRNPAFPHESTADQLFDEGQFEAYRALGEHIARSTLPRAHLTGRALSFQNLEDWLERAQSRSAQGRKRPEAAPQKTTSQAPS
ncbi:patatin-like phospholipase family protein [Candidatus Rhodobacter oscarellae]|nr:patatin-like phospholipase family protein [Candidatus Rhodobacter lobularis]